MKITSIIFNTFHIRGYAHRSRSRIPYARSVLLFSTLLLLIAPTISLADKIYNIVLITSSNSGPYVTTANAIKRSISNNNIGSIQINTLTIKELYTLKRSTPIKTDLFVPIGQRALKETLKYSGDTPVLASLITKYDFNNIIQRGQHSKNSLNIGAVYIDQPLKRHLAFSRLALPNISRYGILVSSSNKHTIDKLNFLIDNDIHHIKILNPGDNVISSLSHVLNDVEVIIALPDPIIFNLRTTRNILLSTYRKRIPIIGFSKSYAKAGALAAIYSTPESIGKQTGEIISFHKKQVYSSNELIPLPKVNSQYFSISVNDKVSRSLGLHVLDADTLKNKLLLIEKTQHE